MEKLRENIDFYYDEEGKIIFTMDYLKERGRCCETGCKNCPFGFSQGHDPHIPAELLLSEKS